MNIKVWEYLISNVYIYWVRLARILLLSSVLIIIRRRSWFSLFLSLELNTIRFVIVLWSIGTIIERTIKYFIIQRVSSILLIYSIIFNIDSLVIFLLIFKLAIVPFHRWGQDLMSNLSRRRMFLFLTIQKLGILILLCHFSVLLIIPYIIIIINIYLLLWKNIRNIMFFSSIVHRRWMILLSQLSLRIILLYFFTYMMILIRVFIFSKVNNTWLKTEDIQITIRILFIRGLPPLIIFYLKWFSLNLIINLSMLLSGLILIIRIVIITIYFRLVYYSIINKWVYIRFRVNDSLITVIIVLIMTIMLY